MKHIHQASSLISLALGAFLVYQGRLLGLEGPYGPGPGFFAFWVGLTLGALSATWLVRASLGPRQVLAADFLPGAGAAVRLLAVAVLLVAFALLLYPLGYNLSMLGLLLVLMLGLGREHWPAKIVIAFVASFGTHYLFEEFLKVPLPFASFGFLRALGL